MSSKESRPRADGAHVRTSRHHGEPSLRGVFLPGNSTSYLRRTHRHWSPTGATLIPRSSSRPRKELGAWRGSVCVNNTCKKTATDKLARIKGSLESRVSPHTITIDSRRVAARAQAPTRRCLDARRRRCLPGVPPLLNTTQSVHRYRQSTSSATHNQGLTPNTPERVLVV